MNSLGYLLSRDPLKGDVLYGCSQTIFFIFLGCFLKLHKCYHSSRKSQELILNRAAGTYVDMWDWIFATSEQLLSISNFIFRRHCAKFFIAKKIRQMKAGTKTNYDITKTSGGVQVWRGHMGQIMSAKMFGFPAALL